MLILQMKYACFNSHLSLLIFDKNGATPLHIACINRREGVVKVLLDCGADAHVMDKVFFDSSSTFCLHVLVFC